MANLLAPIVALAAWTHMMWFWMYATRIPAMRAARMRLDRDAPRGAQMATLPPAVRWKADNYNHLMEQPTVFYLSLIHISRDDSANTEKRSMMLLTRLCTRLCATRSPT